ncbi:MAG: DUF523 and DUF1722 domain-containing protein [Planctomycetota bacterium]|nr:DUF523 and DUF1722 domain-containing protein [Planctomycetota bacterium]
MTNSIRLGIATCLLGEQVRWDGGHKRDEFLVGTVAPHVEWVPVCPEEESGMGVPRPPVRLEQDPHGATRMVDPKSGKDHTAAMTRFSKQRVRALADEELDGYVLKKDSPSCGMERVRLHAEKGMPVRKGVGLFAAELLARFPHLPIEEEGRLNDPGLRENFFERVFAYRRLRQLFIGRWKSGDVVRFHTAEKMLLLAHDPQGYRALGRLVAAVKTVPRADFQTQYSSAFMTVMRKLATPRKHVNVLQHMQGHFSDQLDAAARAELSSLIEDFGHGLVPLIAPVTLFRHYVRRFDVPYLADQSYLEPHPKELMLRNHA